MEERFNGPQSLTDWQFKQKFPNFRKEQNSFPTSAARRGNKAGGGNNLMTTPPPRPWQENSVARLQNTTLRVTGISRDNPSANDKHQRNTQQRAPFSQEEGSKSQSERMGGVLSLDWAPLLSCLGRLHSWAKCCIQQSIWWTVPLCRGHSSHHGAFNSWEN